MVRNFGILKILLCMPTRSDQYNAGPADVNLIATAMNIIGILKRAIRHIDKDTSNKRFMIEIIL